MRHLKNEKTKLTKTCTETRFRQWERGDPSSLEGAWSPTAGPGHFSLNSQRVSSCGTMRLEYNAFVSKIRAIPAQLSEPGELAYAHICRGSSCWALPHLGNPSCCFPVPPPAFPPLLQCPVRLRGRGCLHPLPPLPAPPGRPIMLLPGSSACLPCSPPVSCVHPPPPSPPSSLGSGACRIEAPCDQACAHKALAASWRIIINPLLQVH